jgi:hypothetical protein
MKKILAVMLMAVMVLMASVSAQAACTGAIPTQAKALMLEGAFTKAHTYKLAFYTDSATWSATTTAYSATNEVSGTNYSAGGWTLDSLSVTTSGTTAFMDFADEVNNTVTFTAASTCAMIYDSSISNSTCSASGTPWTCCTGSGTGTCTNAAIWIGTFSAIQPSAGTVTATFPTPDASNAIIRVQ